MQTRSLSFVPRRSFFKAVLLATGYSSVAGIIRINPFVNVQAGDIPNPAGTYVLNLDDFPPLKKDFGSVLAAVPGVPSIIVTRLPGNQFYAVTSVCTHLGCTVGVYNTSLGALVCPCHHSRYEANGQVISGPAPRALYAYTTHFDGGTLLTIDLVTFSFPISAAAAPVNGRLRISFASETGFNYEVRHKSSLTEADWVGVSFAETADGSANETLIMGTGEPIALFVDAAPGSGFYVVVRWKLLGA